MDFNFLLAKLAGQLTLQTLKKRGRGGTALPGLNALRVDPNFVRKSTKNLNTILITGTNGKTTTSRLISDMLVANGAKVLHNRAGSNLLRGVASTLLQRKEEDWAVFEADEAAFSEIAAQTNPKIIVILNLFRDQMDRYGEIDTTAKRWLKVLKEMPEETKVILNVDDPALGFIASELKNSINFGLNDKKLDLKKLPHAVDSIFSPKTNQKLSYDAVYLSHLGDYQDKNSDFARPTLDFQVKNVKSATISGSEFTIQKPSGEVKLNTALPGTFNLYNILSAVVTASSAGVPDEVITQAVTGFKGAFGRFETVEINEKQLTLMLIKNPVGFDQVIQLIGQEEGLQNLVIGINDNLADGTDISWLWDVDIETLTEHANWIVTTGTRANEMALRLQYANWPEQKLKVVNDLNLILETLIHNQDVRKFYVLLTYTAMLEFRSILTQKGLVKPFHED